MIATNYTTARNDLKTFCDKVTDEDEIVIITRKDEKNVVLLSLEKYNDISKAIRNNEYLFKIDTSINQLKEGCGQQHELIEVDDE